MISDHGKKRVRERVGNYSPSFIGKVLAYGRGQNDFSGKMFRYLDSLRYKGFGLGRPIVYGHFVYIFGPENCLVTCYQIPRELRKLL